MSAWQVVPGLAAMVLCLSAGGLLRDGITHVYYGKPKPYDLDAFTKALLLRDLEVLEERSEWPQAARIAAHARAPRSDAAPRTPSLISLPLTHHPAAIRAEADK
jgi:hypothetical protein